MLDFVRTLMSNGQLIKNFWLNGSVWRDGVFMRRVLINRHVCIKLCFFVKSIFCCKMDMRLFVFVLFVLSWYIWNWHLRFWNGWCSKRNYGCLIKIVKYSYELNTVRDFNISLYYQLKSWRLFKFDFIHKICIENFSISKKIYIIDYNIICMKVFL